MNVRSVRLFGGAAVLIIGVAAAALWWASSTAPGARDGLSSRSATTAPATVAGTDALDDLLFDLQLIPLEGRTPPPFTLPTVDGRRVSLADFGGRPVLLYFWATW
ncbi:MAG: peroxiredoxin family protein [Candidatus Rokuibacteriota bacterium]